MNQVEIKRRQIQIISYMLGLVTLVILGRLLLDNGIAYLAVTIESFSIFVLFISDCVPDALGRILRSKGARSQHKNAARIRRNIMLLQCGLGIAGSLLLFVLSDIMAEKLFLMPYSIVAIKIMAPVVFFRAVSGVFLGYFQGSGTQMPTSASCVMRQIFFMGFGILFCNILKNYGNKVSALLRNEDFISMYGTVGVAIAFLLAEILVFLFLFLIYLGSDSRKGRNREGLRMTETFSDSVKGLYGGMKSDLLMQLLSRLPVFFGIFFYQRSVEDIYASASSYGNYYGKYLVVCFFFIFLFILLLMHLNARTGSYLRREEQRLAKESAQAAFHFGMVLTIFGGVFVAVMSSQMAGGFFEGNSKEAEEMLKAGSALIPLIVLSCLFVRILITSGRGHLVLCGMGLMDILFVISLVLFLQILPKGIMGLVYAGLLGTAALYLVTGFFALRLLRVSIDFVRWIAIPSLSAGIMGIVCMFLGRFLTSHLDNLVTLLVCLVIGGILYLVIIVALRSFRESELELIPGGRLIAALARMLNAI